LVFVKDLRELDEVHALLERHDERERIRHGETPPSAVMGDPVTPV
jgi:hypothetical protein